MRNVLALAFIVCAGLAVVAGVSLAPGPVESAQCRRMSPGSIAAIAGCQTALVRPTRHDAPQLGATAPQALAVARLDAAR